MTDPKHRDRSKPAAVVGMLDDAMLAALGGQSKQVLLSADTEEKQAKRHPDIRRDDYTLVPRLLDRGEAIREGEHTLVFVMTGHDGKYWRAVVKRTADRRETYLVTFHRIKQSQRKKARLRGVSVREGRDE